VGHAVRVVDTARGGISAAEEQAMLAGGRVVKTVPPDVHELARMNRQLPSMLEQLGETDVVFLALHGGTGEDGTIQALLDLTGIPYTGSGHLASALAMDKDLSKHLFRRAQVPTADWLMASVTVAQVEQVLGWPVVVKPSKQGSTVGLSLVRDPALLQEAIVEAFEHDDEVMIEAFVPGRELTVGILGGEALPVGEIIPVKELYDYECKYTPGMAREIFPADLSADQTAEIQRLAKQAFVALKLGGCARIDFRMTPTGEFSCLEDNTLPGMTELSLIPQAAAAAGLSFPALCDRIVQLATSSRTSR
ncbi:MAG: D-alanine--D-alanine ligase, partial [Gemmatimonadaceae bacterium]|nr:D-alanine--D-alanine ligase [Gemmatimonadaceae bacterium]